MKIGAIIQTRMTSTRLPGKVLKQVHTTLTMLEAVIERVHSVPTIDRVIIATTTNTTDAPIIQLCHKLKRKYPKLHTFRGSEHNVLSRYYFAAQEHDLDHVIRITSDCPVIDPEVIAHMIQLYTQQLKKSNQIDYLSNVVHRTFPRGLDVEIFRFSALRQAFFDLEATDQEKEHVTLYINSRPETFHLFSHQQPQDNSRHRLTVDTQEDLNLIKLIFGRLYDQNHLFSQIEMIDLLKAHPDWLQLNAQIEQKKTGPTRNSSDQSKFNQLITKIC